MATVSLAWLLSPVLTYGQNPAGTITAGPGGSVRAPAEPTGAEGRRPRTRFVFGADETFSPHEPRGENHRGFHVELIQAIAREMGLEVEVRLRPWDQVREQFLAGEIDAVNLFERESRRNWVDFAESHTVDYSEVFVRNGEASIDGIEHLTGKRVLVERGGLAAEVIPSLAPGVRLIEADDHLEAMLRLSSGEGDAALIPSYSGRTALRTLGITNVTTSGPPVLDSKVAFAVRKGDAEMLQLLNEGLRRVKASGEFGRIYEKHFAPGPHVSDLRSIVRDAAYVLFPIGALVAAVGVWNWSLRRQVAAKTDELNRQLIERSKVENMLRATEARFRLALGGSHITAASFDPGLKCTWICNPPTGTDTATYVGRTPGEFLAGESATALEVVMRQTLSDGRPRTAVFTLSREGLERTISAEMEAVPEDGAVGDPPKFVALATAWVDMTDQVAAQERLASLERQIQRSQKLESLAIFAGGVGHDFNNLLAAVIGNASLARLEVRDNRTLHGFIQGIEDAAKLACELAQQLMAFAGRGRRVAAAIDLPTACDDIVRLLNPTLSRNIIIQTDHDTLARSPLADGTQVRQVIMNLIKNASDALGSKGGTIRLRSGVMSLKAENLVRAVVGGESSAGDYAFLEVSDNGPGFALTRIVQMFDPFVSTKGAGRGLGLAVVAGIVRGHDGVIFVESNPGEGTVIRVCFPLAGGVVVVAEPGWRLREVKKPLPSPITRDQEPVEPFARGDA